MGRRLVVMLAAALLYAPVDASAQLTVAAASDLQSVMPTIVERYEQATGQKVRLYLGSSGQFFSQVQNGAPFDVFLSADESYVRRLVDSGHAVSSAVVPYASGRLAIWSRRDRG